MITLPSGVKLREFFSPDDTREEILARVRENYLKRFPIENQKVKIELLNADYDEKKRKYSLEQYQDALLSGGRMAVPLKGKVRLSDKVTGQPLEEKEVVLANVPYMTDDGTFVYGGSHYTVNNQSRLKSGVYARRKDNGELESHINTQAGTGPSMRVFMEPETGIYRVQVDKSNIKLYPVLRSLGMSDEQLKAAWGDKVLRENQEAFDRKAFDKFYEKLLRNKARPEATPEERMSEIQAVLGKTRLDPEVNTRTLGKPHETISTDTLLDASSKLLRINLGQDIEDDRDHPANRTFHSIEDFLGDRVSKDAGRLGNNLLYRATYDRSLKALKPGYFTPQLESMIVGNSLASPSPGINIVELYDQNRRVVQTGEGGIGSMDSVPMSSRNVHPGQLGLIDPIRSSESRAVGIDQRFAIGAMKGNDNHVYYPLRNKKTGELEYLNPTQLHGKIIAFPAAPSLEKFRTPSPAASAIGGLLGIGAPGEAVPAATVPAPEPAMPKMAADYIFRKDAQLEAQLQQAKSESDRGNYSEKARILRALMQSAPDDWIVDSQDGPVVGITHTPTKWRYHLPRQIIPAGILTSRQKTAADFIGKIAAMPIPPALPEQKPPGFVPVMRNGKMTMGLPEEAEYEIPSAAHQFTETSNLVPMSSTMKGARLFIASKYFVQALPLEKPEGPLVDTLDDDTGGSWSKKMGRKIGALTAPMDGVVKKVGDNYLDFVGADGTEKRYDLKKFFPHNRKTHRTDRPVVQQGQQLKAGDMLAASNYTDDEGRLAMGKNLNVAFMPSPGGAGFEDAIVVSQRAADALTSQHMYGFDVDHRHGTVSDKKRFISLFPNKYTNEQLAKIGENGMVKPGVQLNPGDPVFLSLAPRTLSSRDAAVGNLHKVLRNSFQDMSQVWEKPTIGTVAHAKENRGGLNVNITTSMPLQVGDKVSARQGAKGVISKIVPNDQMYKNKDGDPMDVLINPAALIGRVNPGMVFESMLGKIAHKTGKKYRLPAFGQESFRDFTEHELRSHGIPDREDLDDPVTGKPIPGVLTGRQYFMKLEHTAESKLSGRGEGGSDLNDQPTKGGDEGAKRLGGLQMLALVSHGATEVLRDAHLYRGSRSPDLWRRLQTGESLPSPGVPFVYDKFMASLKGAGINTKKVGDRIHLMALTDKDIDTFAHHELQNADTIDLKTGEPVKGGLMDYSLHGGPEGKGWSYIKLDQPMPNPVMEDPIRRLLGLTEKDMREVLAGRQEYNGKRGPGAIQSALEKLNLDDAEEEAKTVIRLGRKTKRDDAVRRLNFINGLKKAGLQPSEMMINKVPVLPPTFRPVSVMGDMMLTADANYLYRDLMTARDAHRANAQDLPEEDLGDDKLAVYDAVKAVAGLGDPIHVETAEKGVKGLIRQMAGVGGPKTGFFQSKVIGHPVNAVGRSVIIPDSDLDMDQVGVPEEMAWRMFGPFTMRRMVRAGMQATQAAKLVEQQSPLAKKFLMDEMDDRPVLYSRDPALHRFSIMGAMPKIVSGDAVRLSPLVVKPFNADFDGDQMNVHVVVSDEARDEVKKKMMPSKNLFSLKGRDVHYTPSQEFILGLFNASNMKNGKPPVRFPTREAALAAYKAGQIGIDQPVEID